MAIYEAQYVGNRVLAWENYTSTATPLSAQNLNKIQATLEGIDQAAANAFNLLDLGKADKDTVNGMVNSVSFNSDTGVFTFGQVGGTSITVNTVLEKVPASFSYDTQNEKLVIVNQDGSTIEVDLSTVIHQTEFTDSATIAWTINADGSVSAGIKNGSVTDNMIQQGYLADVTQQATDAHTSATNAAYQALLAKSYANGTSNLDDRPTENVDNSYYYSQRSKNSSENSEAWAVGKRNGTDVPITDPTYHNNAEYWARQAAGSVSDMTGATAGTDGTHGLIIQPLAGQQNKVFRGDGTWGDDTELQKIIAPIEVSPATIAHSAGSYIFYNSLLYKVKTPIAIDDTLVVDTNIELAPNVTQQIIAVGARVDSSNTDIQNTRNLIAQTETSPSTHAYTVGQQLIYNNTLYKVKSIIAVDDALVVDTNIELAGDITTQLANLKSNIDTNNQPFTGATSQVDGSIGTVPQPLTGDEDKVLQGSGGWGHKLQIDIVVQNDVYGYIGDNDTFIPFKSQADIDAAVTAAKVGDAATDDVLSGKTFTNASTSGLIGTMTNNGAVSQSLDTSTTSYTVPQGYHNGSGTVSITTETKTQAAGTSNVDVTPTSGKVLSKVTVTPTPSQEKTVTAGTSAASVTPDSGKLLSKVTYNPTPSQEKTITSSRSAQTVTPDSGKLLSKVTVNALTPTGTFSTSTRGTAVDMGATNNYRYVNTNGVSNTNSGTYTFGSTTGATYDMGSTNTYRYVNAANVYSNGVNVGGRLGIGSGAYSRTYSWNMTAQTGTTSKTTYSNTYQHGFFNIEGKSITSVKLVGTSTTESYVMLLGVNTSNQISKIYCGYVTSSKSETKTISGYKLIIFACTTNPVNITFS